MRFAVPTRDPAHARLEGGMDDMKLFDASLKQRRKARDLTQSRAHLPSHLAQEAY